jgi:PilZ domain-containing protein
LRSDNDASDSQRGSIAAFNALWAIVARRSSEFFCTVENITGSGACLQLANTFGVSETFDLTFEHGRTRRPCRVVWRTSDRLGVAFETPEQQKEAG